MKRLGARAEPARAFVFLIVRGRAGGKGSGLGALPITGEDLPTEADEDGHETARARVGNRVETLGEASGGLLGVEVADQRRIFEDRTHREVTGCCRSLDDDVDVRLAPEPDARATEAVVVQAAEDEDEVAIDLRA